MAMKCPKCGYQRKLTDDVPDWQCPECGVAYHKVKADEVAPQADSETINSPIKTPVKIRLTDTSRPQRPVKRGISFRHLRITFLLIILAAVVADAWLTKVRTTDWDRPLRVVIYPINPDQSAVATDYIRGLRAADFQPVADFMAAEAARYGLGIKEPVDLFMGPQVAGIPPLPPVGGDTWQIMLWSLKFRYWSFVVDEYDGPAPHIRIFVIYHDPEVTQALKHSTGLEKGMISVVHAFAAERLRDQNHVVIAHEMLHTLGASDKYDRSSNLPIYPDGYADPQRSPLYPQVYAEIMAGKRAVSASEAIMPDSLEQALIGLRTASEIGWTQ